MKKIVIIIITIFLSAAQIYAQNVSNVAFINEIADKNTVTFADGVNSILIILGEKPKSFFENLKTLDNKGITKGIVKAEGSPLHKGTFALMIARYLNLKDSLMFKIFESERYAFRACAANNIMNYAGSEREILSGGEMIEIMTKVSEFGGGNE